MEKEVTARAYNANLIGNAEIVGNPYRTKKRPNNVYATVFEKGRQAGIKEVVDWIKEYSCLERCDLDTEAYFTAYRWIGEEEWKDQLKEWG